MSENPAWTIIAVLAGILAGSVYGWMLRSWYQTHVLDRCDWRRDIDRERERNREIEKVYGTPSLRARRQP